MDLHKWRVSDKHLDAQWADDDTNEESKVLGVRLWPTADEIATVTPKIDSQLVTRRSMLRQLGSLFDPLGLISPMVVRLKFLIRDSIKPNSGWDDPVDDQMASLFRKFVVQLDDVEPIRVPRLVAASPDSSALVVFCDASAKGIGAVVYAVDWHNGFRSRLLMSRARLLVASSGAGCAFVGGSVTMHWHPSMEVVFRCECGLALDLRTSE